MSITVTMKIVDLFFDRPAVVRRMDRATHRALSKAGSFVRTRARTSLRRRKSVAAPGEAPHVHSTHPFATLKNILFGFDGRDSVVVGPVGFNTRRSRGTIQMSRMVPNIHEFGGQVTRVRRVPVKKAKSQRAATRRQAEAYRALLKSGRVQPDRSFELKEEVLNYPRRAFMQPALEAEQDKFPELWARSVSE